MNKVADFSDTLADRWDELCYHDPEKLNDILRRTGLRKGLRILDIGCGTGVLESYLLPYSPLQIVGVDISPEMIERHEANTRHLSSTSVARTYGTYEENLSTISSPTVFSPISRNRRN